MKLAPDTTALRITSAKTTQAKRPFGRCSLWFTRDPRVVVVSDVGVKVATILLNEQQLDVEELAKLSRPPGVPAEAPKTPPKVAAPGLPSPKARRAPSPPKARRRKPKSKER